MRVEYFFDFSCPFAYLGATQIERVCEAAGAELSWQPMLLGGVFRGLGVTSAAKAVLRLAHGHLDASRWAELYRVPLHFAAGHPFRTVRAMRALIATDAADWGRVIAAIYDSYWVRGEDISEKAALAGALDRAGLDAGATERALAANDDPHIKAELRKRTDEALSRGVFGAPTIFVHPDDGREPVMVFGQDRLPLVAAVLAGFDPEAGTPPDSKARARAAAVLEATPFPEPSAGHPIEMWYDLSSPYSYLASTQIEALAEKVGSPLTWRPMLLGAVFKALAGPLVPILSAPESKRRYLGRDLAHCAAYLGAPFRFSSHFPLRTVTALRLLVLAEKKIAPLGHALFREAWVNDANLDDREVLARGLGAAGLDAAVVDKTGDQAIKDALFQATAEATQKGIFGAPTFVVKQPAGDLLFWGHDRMDMVARAAAGWRPRAG